MERVIKALDQTLKNTDPVSGGGDATKVVGTWHTWSTGGRGKANLELARKQLSDEGFDVWFRVVSRWDNPTRDKVVNEYFLVARRADDVIVVSQSTKGKDVVHVHAEEERWAKSMQEKAQASGALVKYLDFADFELYKAEHGALHAGKQLAPTEYIEGARTLFAPQAYRDALKARSGIGYDDFQALLAKLSKSGFGSTRPTTDKASGLSKSASGSRGSGAGGGKSKPNKVQMAEPIRTLPTHDGEIPDLATDFDAADLLEKLRASPKVQAALADPHAKCDTLLVPIGSYLKKNGFDNVRYRAMYMWLSATSDPTNHFAVIASKGGIDYVFDLSAGQFADKMRGFSGPLILKETDWVMKYDAGSERRLIKYRDFANAQSAVDLFPQLPVPPGQTIEKATILKVPKWYLSLKRAEFEQLVSLPGPPKPLSAQIRAMLKQSGEVLSWEPASGAAGRLGDKGGTIAAGTGSAVNVGEGIRKFGELKIDSSSPEAGSAIDGQPDRKTLSDRIGEEIGSGKDYSKLEENIVLLMVNKQPTGALRASVARAYQSFEVVDDVLTKLSILLRDDLWVTSIRERVLQRLAVFLETTDPDILMEAYRHLQSVVRNALDVVKYHIVDTDMQKVIPLQVRAGDSVPVSVQAFVYDRDPEARIMVVLGDYGNADSVDWQKLADWSSEKIAPQYSGEKNSKKPGETEMTNMIYGSVLFALETEKSERTQTVDNSGVRNDEIGQERAAGDPMSAANIKMNDADSLFVLIQDLMQNFSFRRSGLEWSVVPVTADRPKRDEPGAVADVAPKDVMFRQLYADVMTAILIQAGQLDVSSLSSRDERSTTPGT